MDHPADTAQLALLCEVAGTPKPGNVDRDRDLEGLRFEHFLAGAVGARGGLELAANGAAVGTAFERAVSGMARQRGGNTQFGALLLLVPLVRAAADDLDRPVCEAVVADTTVADAAAFYRAFEHVDVFVGEPPTGADALDVRRGAAAVPAVRDRGLTLRDVLALGADADDVAREWTTGFERSFEAAELIADASGSVLDRAAAAYLRLLADRPDTLVAKRRGMDAAREVQARAASLVEADAFRVDRAAVATFADELVADGINPGTTADLTAAGLFIALERQAVDV
ncbi:triphosphoribosyl-dephospho-CoA synthase [Halovivax sp.]|uniref:triphosphoribosyl-dephospho-CoA synthase n=1 Tax=Halovivax sp. TaxID=1935978 RepID=UPI0025BF4541|nr:triphosphoribosyl-dephospho-CoA synthase [Halovivax sp.]